MTTLLEKIRIGVLANAHKLADAFVDMDSVGSVKVMVRDLKTSLDDLDDAAAEAAGYRRTVSREETALKAQVGELNHNIDFILGDGDDSNDHLAKPMEARLMGLEVSLKEKTDEVNDALDVSQKLNESVSNLRAKYESLVGHLAKLESQQRSTEAKLKAVNTAKKAEALSANDATSSVDNIEARMQREADVADEKFDRAMNGVNSNLDKDVTLAMADSRLAERKARLALEKNAK